MTDTPFVHIGALTLRQDVAPDARRAVVDGLRALPGAVPALLTLTVHEDLGLREGNADLVFVAGFADEEGWREYQAHPAHVALVRDVLAPVLAAKVFVQARR